MKILRKFRGFTTNSSSSYEWLPGGLYYQPTSTGQAPVTHPPLNQYTFTPATGSWLGGALLLAVGLISGVATVILAVRECFRKKKK